MKECWVWRLPAQRNKKEMFELDDAIDVSVDQARERKRRVTMASGVLAIVALITAVLFGMMSF